MLEANQSLDAALSASTLGGVLSYFPSSHGPTVNEGASHRLGSNKPKKKKTFSVADFSEYSPPVEADLSLENVVERNTFVKLGTRQ